jgi:2-oxoisovalerate dehydrogenase E2 component (dihydrolipoyl transacylase)
LAAYILDQQTLTSTPEPGTTDIKVIGLRKKIAEKMALSKSRIPHITIVEEIDMTELEDLRAKLNDLHSQNHGKLTILPFIMRAIVGAVSDHPEMNARFDDLANVIRQYGSVHLGIATQTENGLTVPVVKNAGGLNMWQSASEILRLSDAVRSGTADMDQLSGSTITLTSLGPLGAVATTPIINHPEVAIIGVNKMMIRPVWDGAEFIPRKMMNLSCSFDHRVIDGWNAAVFVQKLKTLLEDPVMMIMAD